MAFRKPREVPSYFGHDRAGREEMLACNQNPNTRPGTVRAIPLDNFLVHRTALETGIIKSALGAMAPGVEVHCKVTWDLAFPGTPVKRTTMESSPQKPSRAR